METPRLTVILFAATAFVVAAVIALSLHSWAVLFIVLAVLFGASALVVWAASRSVEEERRRRYPEPHAGTS